MELFLFNREFLPFLFFLHPLLKPSNYTLNILKLLHPLKFSTNVCHPLLVLFFSRVKFRVQNQIPIILSLPLRHLRVSLQIWLQTPIETNANCVVLEQVLFGPYQSFLYGV